MKRNWVLLMVFAFLPIHAFGDFVPGRTRAVAEANLTVQHGTGQLREIRTAYASLLKTDGRGYTGFTLQLDQRSPQAFRIRETKARDCGHVFRGTADAWGSRATAHIEEYNPALCNREGVAFWKAEVALPGPQGPSVLQLEGPAEYFLLSQ